jgi:valyl-tRNA synthetase
MAAKLNAAITDATQAIEDYRFSDAGQIIYSLLWDDFADWYLEASKVSPNHDFLVHTLETILTLLHPIAPFVTEAIWSELPWQSGQLITTPWPVADKTRTKVDLFEVGFFETTKSVIQTARTLMAEEQLSKATILTTDQKLIESTDLIKRLAKAGEVKLVQEGSGLYLGALTPAWIQADAQLIAARKHRLQAQLKEKQTYLKSLDAKLANARYIESAPAAIVEQTRHLHTETAELLAKLTEQLHALGQ